MASSDYAIQTKILKAGKKTLLRSAQGVDVLYDFCISTSIEPPSFVAKDQHKAINYNKVKSVLQHRYCLVEKYF